MKILRRPQSFPSNLAAQGLAAGSNGSGGSGGGGGKGQPKSLKQREEEYAQARLRILGSAGDEVQVDPTEEEEAIVLKEGEEEAAKPVVVAAASPDPPCGNAVSRAPKGPDGTKGFGKAR